MLGLHQGQLQHPPHQKARHIAATIKATPAKKVVSTMTSSIYGLSNLTFFRSSLSTLQFKWLRRPSSTAKSMRARANL